MRGEMEYLNVVLEQDSEAIVVAFDLCSSSDVVEKLIARGELRRYTKLLGEIKHHLADAQRKVAFVLDKFTGDGWLLLFPTKDNKGNPIDGRLILQFMHDFSVWFKRAFRELVGNYLDMQPSTTGVTFGID